jgi:ParB family chromosome partitioning protein
VPIASISVGRRLRVLQPSAVEALAESLRALGLIQPITVVANPTPVRVARPRRHTTPAVDRPATTYRLVAGLHRLRAAESLGWTQIACVVVGLTEAQAELVEVDENLHRANLSVLERGEHLVHRFELLEALGLRQHRGRPSREALERGVWTTQRVADQFGISTRVVEYSMQIALALPLEVRDLVRESALANSVESLRALADAGEDQAEIAALMLQGQEFHNAQYMARHRFTACQTCGETLPSDFGSDVWHCPSCNGHANRHEVFSGRTRTHPVCPRCGARADPPARTAAADPATLNTPSTQADPQAAFAQAATQTAQSLAAAPARHPVLEAQRAVSELTSAIEHVLRLNVEELSSRIRNLHDASRSDHVNRSLRQLQDWLDAAMREVW